jgi:predicted permease
MTDALQDVRYAFRTLSRAPGFATAAVLTLALGIGANTAIFTALDHLILRSLPVEHPEQLVNVVTSRPNGINYNLSYPWFAALRDDNAVFSGVLAHSPSPVTLTSGSAAERLEAGAISAGFFRTLALPLTLGRDFTTDEDQPGAARDVVVLGYGFWRRRFNADSGVLGRTIGLNGRPFTVVGVAARGFSGLTRGIEEQAWTPITLAGRTVTPDFATRTRISWLNVVARLTADHTPERATEILTAFDQHQVELGQRDTTEHTKLLPAARGLTWAVSEYKEPLGILMAAVAMVLLVACANVASLVLARASARRREIAIRVSLGAGPARLFRQLITESAVLALAGGVAGVALAVWLADAVPTLRTSWGEPLAGAAGLDARIVGFAALATAFTIIVFGLAPAIHVVKSDVVTGLKDGAAVRRPGRRIGLRDALVIGQVAVSLVLLTGAALFLRTLVGLASVSPGFDAQGVVLAGFDLEPRGYDLAQRQQFYGRLEQRLAALPGVMSATFAATITPSPGGMNWGGVRFEGYTAAPNENAGFDVNRVGPRYFETLRIPVLHGRGFDERDRPGAPAVIVVNEGIARRYFRGENPIGRRIWDGPDATAQSYEIVGVVAGGKYRGLRERDELMAYVPALRNAPWSATMIVRGGATAGVIEQLRRELRALDPLLPLVGTRTMRDHLEMATSRERLLAALATALGLLALALGAVGLFGLLSYAVARRTREFGVRVALGARPADVLGLVVREGLSRAGLGLALGAVAALLVTRVFRAMLYDVSPGDPLSFLAAGAVLGLVALGACLVPARRAARIEPMTALRTE